MNKIKKYFWSRIDYIITILLIILVVIFWCLTSRLNEPYKGLFINLTAGMIGSIVTIWGIEFLRRQKFEKQWSVAKKVAKTDIKKLINVLTSYISGPLGVTVDSYKDEKKSLEEWSNEAIKKIVADFTQRNLNEILNGLSVEQWKNLKIDLPFIYLSLSEKCTLYREVLPPEVFGQLLKIKNNFDDFYLSFGLLPELFTENETNWPTNRGGLENNKAIRIVLIKNFSNNLKIYFDDIKILMDLVYDKKP